MRPIFVVVSLIFTVICQLLAQQTQLSGPVEGFSFDAPTGSFRAVIGLPGSASLGPAILDGFALGSVAPRKDYGLAFKDGNCAIVSGLGTARPSTSALSGAVGRFERVAWSADGSAAVLFSASGTSIQIIAGLPDAATPQASIDLSFLGGSLSAIGADALGKRLAIGIAGGSGGVYLIADGGDPVLLLASSKPIALEFSDDGSELYALDGDTRELTRLRLAESISNPFFLEGLVDPVAIKSGRDESNRQVLYVAGRNDRLLRIYDAASHQTVTDLPLDFPPTELAYFGRNSFLLGQRGNSADPLWLFTTTPRTAVYFVPAAPAASGGPQ